jgi:long-chain acyl-CoA synthetase
MRQASAAMISDFKTLVEMQLKTCETNATRPAFGVRLGDEYCWYSYAQFGHLVARFRTVLARKGVSSGERVSGYLSMG